MTSDHVAMSVAKATYVKAAKAIEAAKLTVIMKGAKALECYGNLLCDF